jgi:hypothetical protein
MKSITSHIPLIVTTTILLVAMLLLSTGRLEYCGQPEALRPRIDVAAAAERRGPTPAPPPKIVVVHVEADRSDLEIGWAEN